MFFRKDKNDRRVLKMLDGRQVKYVTKRIILPDGNPDSEIVSKVGRIAFVNGDISILSEEKEIFRCNAKNAKYHVLLSGNGVTVEGENSISGEYESLTAYYSYYR